MYDFVLILSYCKDWGDLKMDRKTLINISENRQDLTFVLANRNYDRIGILNNVDINTLRYHVGMNGQEISFDVHKFLDGIEENIWDCIIDLKLLWIKEFDVYFEIYVAMEDSSSTKKNNNRDIAV